MQKGYYYMKTVYFLICTFILTACSDLDPHQTIIDDNSEETIELREKYADKITGRWYLKQEPQEYYYKQFERLYNIALEQYYEFHENGNITGRVVMKAKRADGSPTATGGEWFVTDYRIQGLWKLVHTASDDTDRLRFEAHLSPDDTDDTAMIVLFDNAYLHFYHADDDILCIENPVTFLNQTIVMHRVDGEPSGMGESADM